MRRYIAGELPVPRVIELALVIRVVGIDELTDDELNSLIAVAPRLTAIPPAQVQMGICEY